MLFDSVFKSLASLLPILWNCSQCLVIIQCICLSTTTCLSLRGGVIISSLTDPGKSRQGAETQGKKGVKVPENPWRDVFESGPELLVYSYIANFVQYFFSLICLLSCLCQIDQNREVPRAADYPCLPRNLRRNSSSSLFIFHFDVLPFNPTAFHSFNH
jgi:hypothetical protein